ncbi:MAG: YraN family protein [Candidatus Omnitrophica bacterium]|nr:YraN family protein [Candidatus Omnitrophota bacterium]
MKIKPDPKPFRFSLGDRGEVLACGFLRGRGYKIIEKNYKCALGEIDLVAEREGRIAFVEIKTRTDTRFGAPQEAVGPKKQEKLLRLAAWYLKEKEMKDVPVSFDVVAVVWDGAKAPQVRVFQDAFGEKEDAC